MLTSASERIEETSKAGPSIQLQPRSVALRLHKVWQVQTVRPTERNKLFVSFKHGNTFQEVAAFAARFR